MAEHKLIRIPLSKLRHGTAFRPASQFRHARRTGAVPAVAAAPSCVGFACTGVDPVNQSNCSVGGYPVSGYTKTISGLGTIRLMYQGSCQANWGEADGASTSAWITAYDVVGGFEYEIPPYNLSPYNYGWTSMVDGQVNAAACIGFARPDPALRGTAGPAQRAGRLGVLTPGMSRGHRSGRRDIRVSGLSRSRAPRVGAGSRTGTAA